MRLTDHVTPNFLDIEKAFDTIWHNGLLYKLPKMDFSASLIKLISSSLSSRKFCLGGRRNVNAKDNENRGSTRFRPVPPTETTQQISDKK
jgi:hypothetical protein